MKRLSKILLCLVLAIGLVYTPVYIPVLETTPMVAVADAATIKISKKTATVKVGGTLKLKISGTSKKVTWSSSKKSVATVSAKGVVTGKKAGKATITAKVNGKKYTCKITVKEAPKLNKTKSTLYVGSTTTLKVTGTTKKVTWSSSTKSVATVSSKGKVTAKKAGTTTITAKVGTKKLTCKVTVKNKVIKVTDLDFAKTTVYVNRGEQTSLSLKVTPVNTTQKITWSSEDESIAKVDSKGNVTGVGEGRVKIWAKAGTISDYCYVRVQIPKVESIAISQDYLTLEHDETAKLEAAVYPANADQTVIWKSSDEKIAKVDENGNVTAVSAGTTKITAKAGYYSATCTVVVNAPVFQMGEVWTVDGQWRFKVNSVTYHNQCNSYNSATGIQVVTVNYTYWCDGPSFYSNGLNFSHLDFDVYDAVGEAGAHYTCVDDLKSTYLSTGSFCTASEAFILKNESGKITFNVNHRDINFVNQKASFQLDFGVDLDNVKEVRAFLEQDMMLNGTEAKTSENETYYYYQKTKTIDGFSVKSKLTYFPDRDYFEYKLECPNGPTRFVNIALPGADYTGTEIADGTVNVYFSGMGTDTNTASVFSSQLDLDLDSYSTANDHIFNVDESTWYAADADYVQEQSNQFLDLAIAGWQDLLVSNYHGVRVDLGALGFSQL